MRNRRLMIVITVLAVLAGLQHLLWQWRHPLPGPPGTGRGRHGDARLHADRLSDAPAERHAAADRDSTITPTATPSIVTVTPLDKDVICRFGPSDLFSTEAAFKVGQVALVLGTDAAGGWWYIENPSRAGRYCWVSAALTHMEGNSLSVPIQDPPIPFVEGVSVGMDPKNASIACGAFPYTFSVSFKITANGPTTVTYVRSKSNGSSGGPQTVIFTKSGTKVFDDSYAVGGPGDYWFKVSVSSPNKISGQGSATMSCRRSATAVVANIWSSEDPGVWRSPGGRALPGD
jgi:hypothetical protein